MLLTLFLLAYCMQFYLFFLSIKLCIAFLLLLGEDGNYICAGSDDGIIFIWDRTTTEIMTALRGDVSIVNCVQPHPSACFIASSGIDAAVKFWSPVGEVSFIVLVLQQTTSRHNHSNKWHRVPNLWLVLS